MFDRKIRLHGRRVAKKVAVAVAEAAEERVGPEQVVRVRRPPVVVDWPIGLVSWRNTFTIHTRPLASVFTINNNPLLNRLIHGIMVFPATWVRFYCNLFLFGWYFYLWKTALISCWKLIESACPTLSSFKATSFKIYIEMVLNKITNILNHFYANFLDE